MKKGYSKKREELQARLTEIQTILSTISRAKSEKWQEVTLQPPTAVIVVKGPAVPAVLAYIEADYAREQLGIQEELQKIGG